MRGKDKCRILREIRRKIADENDIVLLTEECRFKGECRGTCPKCESELQYLERQLEHRRRIGKAVTVSAISVGLLTSAAGCQSIGQPEGDYIPGAPDETATVETAGSLVSEPETTEPTSFSPEDNINQEVYGPPPDDIYELEGDVAYLPEETEYTPEDNVEAPVYGPPTITEDVQ